MDLNELKLSVAAADDAEREAEAAELMMENEGGRGSLARNSTLVDVEDDDDDENDDLESSLSDAVVLLEDIKILLLCLSQPRNLSEMHKFTGHEVQRLLGEVTGYLEEQGVGQEIFDNIPQEKFNIYD